MEAEPTLSERHARDEAVMAELRAGGESFQATASVVPNSTDRDRLFQLLSEEITDLYRYQDRCRDTRQIPIVRLRRA